MNYFQWRIWCKGLTDVAANKVKKLSRFLQTLPLHSFKILGQVTKSSSEKSKYFNRMFWRWIFWTSDVAIIFVMLKCSKFFPHNIKIHYQLCEIAKHNVSYIFFRRQKKTLYGQIMNSYWWTNLILKGKLEE